MRGLALSVALGHRAGAADQATAYLVDYLRLFAEADYARPLARDRAVSLALLDDIAGAPGTDAAVAAATAGLCDALRDDAGAWTDPEVTLRDREIDVLTRLERQTDKQIAEALKLSFHGVRYRVRSIFAKLGAHGRREAVHCARARGILPPAEEAPESGDSSSLTWRFTRCSRSEPSDVRVRHVVAEVATGTCRPHAGRARWPGRRRSSAWETRRSTAPPRR